MNAPLIFAAASESRNVIKLARSRETPRAFGIASRDTGSSKLLMRLVELNGLEPTTS
jgi:hypothetical protein